MVMAEDISSAECPVSLLSRLPGISDTAKDMISFTNIKEIAPGAMPFGVNVSNWPARWFDAVKIAASEERRVDNAISKHAKTLS